MARVQVAECPTCGQPRGERHRATTRAPEVEDLMRWDWDGIAEATDGCPVEPDGVCEHGHTSWLRRLALI
jgi:hypothetical protein